VKALIIRPGALGDTLMLMPAIARLRALVDIVLVGRLPGIDFLRPYVHLCMNYEGPGWHALFLEALNHAPALPLPPVDLAVAFLTDPEGRVGHNLKASMPGKAVLLFPPFPPRDREIHVGLYLAQCLERAGLPLEPGICIEAASKHALLEGQPPRAREGRIVFHPGSGSETKNHPPGFWLELIGRVGKEFPANKEGFVLLLGRAEEQLHPFYENNLRDLRTEIHFSPARETLCSLLERAPLYIGHDSGITHLAAMLGTPTIALFKNSEVGQWRPLGPSVAVIEGSEGGPELLARVLEEADSFTGDL
jgi:heptosyltransferase-3